MLWYGIRAEDRRCGYPSAFGDADIKSCGVPILQSGRDFYLTSTALHRPGASGDSREQADFVDAAKVPFVVLPGGLKLPAGLDWQTGDLGVMFWKGKVVYVVVGDTGPSRKIGEASRAALARLTGNPLKTIGGNDPATTLLFPGTRSAILDHWPLDPQRIEVEGQKLVAKLGGAAAVAKCPGFTGFK
jgi:hypothetical protein